MKKQMHQFFFGTSLGQNKVLNIAWLLFRLHIGLSMAIHAGWPKMEHGMAPAWFNEQVAGLGFNFPSSAFWATLSSWGEFVGGICIAIGLFTRFSALQLAFQFFVISFLWYNSPEPVTGMYFQNTLFMGYLFTAFAGGGRYSLDRIIYTRKKEGRSLALKTAVTVLLLFTSTALTAQNKSSHHAGSNTGVINTVISIKDFSPLAGNWKGTLTYLDYSSNKPVIIPAAALFSIDNDSILVRNLYYTDEPDKNEKDSFVVTANGKQLNQDKLIKKSIRPDGAVEIILESGGPDGNDNREAIFKHVWIISANRLTITKLVRYRGEKKFFERHRYDFTR